MQKHEIVKLKNGLQIHFLIDKAFTTSSIQMCFKVGWRNDPEEYRGLAHLFEHLVGKRTGKFRGKSEFAQILEQSGIVSNAYTSPDVTVYWQNQTNENLLTSLEYLFEAIYNSVFDLDDLEKEKKVVMTEARRYLDSDSSILWRAVAANLFSGTSLDRMFFGDEKTMKNITLEQFSKFYEIYKNPKNATLFIGTNSAKSKEKVVKYLNEFYKYVKNKQRFSGEKVPAYEDKFAEIVKVKNIKKGDKSQSSLRLAFRVDEKLNTKEKVAFVVLSQAMLGGLTGKLIKKLRDELALVYSVGLGMEDFKQGVGFINFATDCAKDKKNVVVSEIKKFIYNLETELTQACVDAVVPTAIYQNQRPVFVHDDLEELMEAVIYNQKYLQRKEGMEILKKIKVSDLIKLSKKLFKDKNSTSVFLN